MCINTTNVVLAANGGDIKFALTFFHIKKHTQMKKIVLPFLTFACFASAANAQIAIAPEAGLNMANMTFKPSSTTSMKVGATVGAIVDLGLSDNLFIQPGLFYMMNGCKLKGTAPFPDVNVNVSTLEIPVNVEYKFGDVGGGRFFLGAGPYLGINVGGNLKASGSPSTSIKYGNDSSSNLKRMDLGLGLNVGYQLQNNLYFRVRYQMGLSNLQPKGDANNSAKTSAIGITVGYYLGGNKHKKSKKGAMKK